MLNQIGPIPMHSLISRSIQHGPQADPRSARLLEIVLWIANIGSAFCVTRYLFNMNRVFVFFDRDPHSLLAFIGERRRFSSALVGVGSDPVIGLGNISFPLNPDWFLSYLLAATSAGDLRDGPLAFAIGATELFAVTALCARALSFTAGPALASGWLITLTTWPLFGWPFILTLWFLFPHTGETLAISTLMALAALEIGRKPGWLSTLCAIGIFLGITYITLALPTSLVLVLPIPILFAGSRFLFGTDARGRVVILLSWAAIGIGVLACGYVHYLVGLLTYTALGFFPDLGMRAALISEASMLFWPPAITAWSLETIFTPGRTFILGGLAGNAMMAWLGSPRQRQLGLAVVVAEFFFLAIGLTNYVSNFWFGPSIWYFENFLFPFFAMGCCYLVVTLLSQLWRFLRSRQFPFLRERTPYLANMALSLSLPGLVAVHALINGSAIQQANQQSSLFKFGASYPESQTEITRFLKSEIGLVPGQPFRGRSATMLGFILPNEQSAARINQVYYLALFATGNLHDGPGLWQDDIPTLMEYNSLMTPAYLVVMRRFFTEASERVGRNTVVMRRVDLRMLKVLGVRFLLTDAPIDGPQLRMQMRIPTPREDRARLGLSELELNHFDIYLYELTDVNVGQFSPTRFKVIPDAGNILAELSDSSLALEKTVIVDQPLRDDLTTATLKTFSVDRDHYRVRAVSEGPDVLLLPIEFSRCLRVSSRSAGILPELFRADLLLTGVVFENELDADISFHSGPFSNSRCRLDDLADANRLDMGHAFKALPDYAVLGLSPH
jgi:hypothetical protein